jgi:hypothetical protein
VTGGRTLNKKQEKKKKFIFVFVCVCEAIIISLPVI